MKKAHVQHTRVIPKVKISDELALRLHQIAFRAYKRSHKDLADEVLQDRSDWLYTAIPLAVDHAISHYISEKHYEISPSDFRLMVKTEGRGESAVAKAVKKLQGAIQGLKDVLPKEGSPAPLGQALHPPPFEQMRALYCFGETESDGLDGDGDDAETREDRWDMRFSPAAVQETLKLWLDLMEKLHRQAGMGAAPASAKVDFVRQLAAFWKREISERLGSSRREPVKGFKEGYAYQQGPFADFVRAAAEGIPLGFPRTAWDDAIRRVAG